MNAYDFDNTIYAGDSTVDFYLYCVKRYPRVAVYSLRLAWPALMFLTGRMSKTRFKQRFFGFLAYLPDVDRAVEDFWEKHMARIKPFYLERRRADDVIISASPEFLLRPALNKLNVSGLIASRVDRRTGVYEGLNCDGEEKARRLDRELPDARIEDFYSDSRSDAPLARRARRAYMVRAERIEPWPRD